ncbi:hypothetical protein MSG28_006836 [Choristoneura fumiferana]|uniref:Uncharacterized protein n=1 Tax=Choristoneura fumiferana TaxID=7141 RepID=A0ACC0JLB8_CHOFU|nr:hypothetical protein MSG28_006836 [Choristoneura fumiferana]
MQCKPMRPADYQLIEAQLLKNFEKGNAKRRAGMYGWSGPSLEESDPEGDCFHPMTFPGQMAESFSSSVSSMSASMTSSVNIPSVQPRLKRNKKVPRIDGDPTAEISHMSFRIVSLSCVLLHKDILVPTPLSSDIISPLSAMKMQEASNKFFEGLGAAPATNQAIENAAGRNHLRLMASEMTLDGIEKVTTLGSQTVCEAAIHRLLVQECLYRQSEDSDESECFDLLRFESKEEEDSRGRPDIRVNFKQSSKYMRISGEKRLVYPTTDVVVKCMPCHVDVELTLIERMAATFFNGPNSTAPPPSNTRNQFNCTLQCPDLNATLRFPIADLRPNINREIRRVRPDYLVFKLQKANINSQQSPSARPMPTTVTIKCTSLDLYYYEHGNSSGTHIARSTIDEAFVGDILRGDNTAPLPTITLTFKPNKAPKGPFDSLHDDSAFEPATANPMTTSMYIMNNLHSSQPSPFSGKKTAHQSITKHEGSPHGELFSMDREEGKRESGLLDGQDEELIVPGTEEEMSDFSTSAIENSAIHLDFNLPILSLQLESKQLYEIIYNRINSDLLLWEPQIEDALEISPLMYTTIYPAFGMCKGTGYDSDSGSTSSEEENLYYSTYDNKLKKGIGAAKPNVFEKKETHNFCLSFNVGKGLLTIYAPVRDSNKHVVPGQMGELVLEAHKLTLCEVSGLEGRPKTAQLCLRAGKVTLYHEALLTIPSEKPGLRLFGKTLPPHLKSTIYPSGKGVAIKERLHTKDMFSMALKVEPDSETPGLKVTMK